MYACNSSHVRLRFADVLIIRLPLALIVIYCLWFTISFNAGFNAVFCESAKMCYVVVREVKLNVIGNGCFVATFLFTWSLTKMKSLSSVWRVSFKCGVELRQRDRETHR